MAPHLPVGYWHRDRLRSQRRGALGIRAVLHPMSQRTLGGESTNGRNQLAASRHAPAGSRLLTMGISPEPVEEVRRRIIGIRRGSGLDLVRAYYAPNSGFAGSMFDSFGNNPASQFTSDDLVAASLLDVRFGPAAVQELLIKHSADALLQKIPADANVTLWNTELPRSSAAWRLWDVLVGIDEVGPTRASKLMAWKRPHLLPILDSVIMERLGLGDRDQWEGPRGGP